jgi:hypothetical protein
VAQPNCNVEHSEVDSLYSSNFFNTIKISAFALSIKLKPFQAFQEFLR